MAGCRADACSRSRRVTMAPAAARMRAVTAWMVVAGRARGSVPAQLETCGKVIAAWCRCRGGRRSGRRRSRLRLCGCRCRARCRRVRAWAIWLCSRTWPSWWASAVTAWAGVASGLIRILRLRQVVNPSAPAQLARSTVKPSRRARWVSAVQAASACASGRRRAGASGRCGRRAAARSPSPGQRRRISSVF